MRCGECGKEIVSVMVKKVISHTSHFSELEKLRASKMVDSGRYRRVNILDGLNDGEGRGVEGGRLGESVVRRKRRKLLEPIEKSLQIE